MCVACVQLYESDSNEAKRELIARKCAEDQHRSVDHADCATCSIRRLRGFKAIKMACIGSKHQLTIEDKEMCADCDAKFLEFEKFCIHSDTCEEESCDCSWKDRCSHSSSTVMKDLTPIIFVLVIVNNRTRKIDKVESFCGHNAVDQFYQALGNKHKIFYHI